MTNKLFPVIKYHCAHFYKKILRTYFKQSIGKKKFCVISNDCWGGELYKILDRPFNTPFIGLMLMSPCYINLLEDPKHFLSLPLNFKKDSRYTIVQEMKATSIFPTAVLGDTGIEIHFLHYDSQATASEKWARRVKRIDWDNLFIKYDCGKDYADAASVEKFINLPFANKLLFGTENFGKKEVIVLKKYSADALIQFRNCFLNLNPVGWLTGNQFIKNSFQKFICRNAYKYI